MVALQNAGDRLMVVLFVGAESTFAYFEATHKYLERYGKPLAFYSDKASVFRVIKRPMAPGIEGVEGSPEAHEAVKADLAIRYLEKRGSYGAAIEMLKVMAWTPLL